MFKVSQKVELQKTGTPVLDGIRGVVVGFHGDEFPIVQFNIKPIGYDPVICITDSCVKAV